MSDRVFKTNKEVPIGSDMTGIRKACIGLRKVVSPFVKDKVDRVLSFNMKGENVQDYIRQLLESESPVMIARFGSTELTALEGYRCAINLKNTYRYITKRIDHIGYANYIARNMWELSGFFPSNENTLNRFCELMIDLIPEVDVLGSWRIEEHLFDKELEKTIKVPLSDLEPYYFNNPWTTAIEGRKVLVVHPFEDTIRKQHERYEKLFADKRLTPNYDLQTLKAVQSIAGNKPAEFDNWFQALDWMKGEIDKRDFDVAIIGCGAYGFPLAAHVKKIGKKAVHLGGAVQYLFGIWSNAVKDSPEMNGLRNEYWVRPSLEETPQRSKVVENSRYW